ncbi:mechanosensitive ion channel family protein [Gordonia sp. HY285]|uniref:mechanosensitive ion channel family protein n=1 Tax=Gordonia liuliyuniae TaxID=2911517 RepID=UPI001F32F1FD|nr:mechanosensitive ion channel domain-containing protein [Gordonia liuliyuniae]MCF8611787.1 mechanosensitive ion channel family protein [Gordonia liuliyuniae]
MTTQSLAFEWTDTNRTWLIETPIRIVCFIVAALVVRWLLFRVIDRVTKPRASRDDGGKRLVRGLRERAGARSSPKANARRAQRAKTIGSVLKSTVSVVILVWLVLSILSELDVNIAPFIASAGILGLAIGFGAQHLVADVVSGVFMMMEDQYGVGDIADFGEVIGEIESVGLRITTVRDMDGTLWYIRNGEIQRVGNMSQDFAVARLEVPVAVDADLERAQDVALSAALRAARDAEIVEEVLGEPEMLGVQEVTSSHAMLRMTVTTKPGAQWGVQRHLRSRVLGEFERESIRLPMQSWGAALAGAAR